MIEIRRILHPVDFSDASRHALEHAVAIAKWYEAQITALHVIRTRPLAQPPILAVEPAVTPAGSPMRQSLQDQLRTWLEPARQAGLSTEERLDDGDPAECIVGDAAEIGADLIVMGTHGLSGFERLMLGSVTEKVLRKATCPVLTVPPKARTTAKVPYKRLLCPIDFSPSSLAALQFAFSLAKEADAQLTLLHVFDWPPEDELLIERLAVPDFQGLMEQQARERLNALIPEDVRTWSQPAAVIRYGKPYRQVLETAEDGAADLIVIGVRGRHPVDLRLFGSTTNQVVRSASCPVLTIQRTAQHAP